MEPMPGHGSPVILHETIGPAVDARAGPVRFPIPDSGRSGRPARSIVIAIQINRGGRSSRDAEG